MTLHRTLLSLVALYLCMVSHSSLVSVSGHYAAPSVGSLTIRSVDEGSVTVTLADRRARRGVETPLAECTFSYKTDDVGPRGAHPPAAAVIVEPTSGKVDVRSVSQQLAGSCVSSTVGYWTYEMCFGRHLKQSHADDVYWLARTDATAPIELNADGQSYTIAGGDRCDALSPPKPRQAKINFACKTSATIPQIMSVRESSTCSYDLQIATSHVCSDPSFPVLSNDAAPSSSFESTPDLGSEDWFIELVQIESNNDDASSSSASAPVLMCQAYSLEYRATSVASLRFASFSLAIRHLQGDPKSHRSQIAHLPPEYRMHTARRPGRTPVPLENIDAKYASIALQATPPSDSDYDGQLSAIKVYA